MQLSKAEAEHSEFSHTVFCFAVGAEPPEHLVHTDENAIDLSTTYHLMGWDATGQHARVKQGSPGAIGEYSLDIDHHTDLILQVLAAPSTYSRQNHIQ
jgi:hypothetical protein